MNCLVTLFTVYSFEGLVIRNIINHFKDWEYSFYKSAQGAELDLVLQKGTRKIGIEIKASNQPVLTKGTYIAIEDIQPDLVWIVTPSSDEFLLKDKIRVGTLSHFLKGTSKYPVPPYAGEFEN